MKKTLFLLLFSLLLPGSFYAQAVSSSEGAELLEEIPREKIFVHYNSSLLFSGEYLYYKLYNLHSETGDLSNISKVAYVALIGKDGETVFKHKILLDNGQGQGDFFIPTTVPSGNYKLLGYTNWMKNDGTFFAGDLTVINPYRGDQSAISGNPAGDSSVSEISSERIPPELKNPPEEADAAVKITTESDHFGRREKVVLDFEGVPGNYSLSVRKKDTVRIAQKFSSKNFDELFKNRNSRRDSVFLPELRGNLISGRIVPNASGANKGLAGEKVAFSIPGEDFVFKIATTDNKGEFYISLDDTYATSEALMQILGDSSENFSIHLDSLPKINTSNINFGSFSISPDMEEWILNRSIKNQIENAYYSVKPDTLMVLERKEPFYVKQPTVYDLDAYTRFATIRETFVEIIRFSWISSIREDSKIIVRQPEGAINYNLPPLLLVDGVMVQDHDLFINYPAKYVQSIHILRDNFFLGSHIFAGIVDVKTIEGNFPEMMIQKDIKKIDLKLPEPKKFYFKQTYGNQATNESSRIPDLRTQLLWKPSVEINSRTKSLDFYTSDVPGTFEIQLEGFTREGNPVSVKKEILVVPRELR